MGGTSRSPADRRRGRPSRSGCRWPVRLEGRPMSSSERAPEILIVDDDRELRDVLRLILLEEGYRVTVATDGAGALESLRAGLRPAMILLDLMMPGMNGWSFRDALLADP